MEAFYLKRGFLNLALAKVVDIGFSLHTKKETKFFLYAFAKNQRSNISDKEKAALKLISKSLMVATEKQLQTLIKKGSICEVKNE